MQLQREKPPEKTAFESRRGGSCPVLYAEDGPGRSSQGKTWVPGAWPCAQEPRDCQRLEGSEGRERRWRTGPGDSRLPAEVSLGRRW